MDAPAATGDSLPAICRQIEATLNVTIRPHGAWYRAEQCPLCDSSSGFNIGPDGQRYFCFA
ncbi:unnamed protein product, partial [marine sediment metagenome]